MKKVKFCSAERNSLDYGVLCYHLEKYLYSKSNLSTVGSAQNDLMMHNVIANVQSEPGPVKISHSMFKKDKEKGRDKEIKKKKLCSLIISNYPIN